MRTVTAELTCDAPYMVTVGEKVLRMLADSFLAVAAAFIVNFTRRCLRSGAVLNVVSYSEGSIYF